MPQASFPASASTFSTKLTRSQYLAAWGDYVGGDARAGKKPQLIRDDLTYPHPGDPRVAGHIVPRPLIPPHAEQPAPEQATYQDSYLSSRNLQTIDQLQAALMVEQRKRARLEAQLARVRLDGVL